MTEKIDKKRRTTLRIIGTTGLAAAGVISTSGSAVAQQNPTITIDDGGPTEVVGGGVTSYEAVEETNRPLPNLQEIIVEVTGINETAETASGTVTAISRGQGQGAQRDTTEFTDAPVSLAGSNEVGIAQEELEILRLEIPDLFLNLLGLQVELDLELVVTAVEGQGLLGDLLVALLGSN